MPVSSWAQLSCYWDFKRRLFCIAPSVCVRINNETKTCFPCRKVYLETRSRAINADTTAARPKMIYPIWGLQSKHYIFSVVNLSQFILQHNDLSVVGQYFWECSIWKLICFICSDVFFVFASCKCSSCQVLLAQICKDTNSLNYADNYLCWKWWCSLSFGKQKKCVNTLN